MLKETLPSTDSPKMLLVRKIVRKILISKQVQAAPLSEIFGVRNILEFRIWGFFNRSNALHLHSIQDQYTSSMWENTP